MPACTSASSRTRPAGPTKGAPSRSSRSPGCSPTNMAAEPLLPAPNTVCVAFSQSGHARQSAAAWRSLGRVGLGGTRSAAESGIPEPFPALAARKHGGVGSPSRGIRAGGLAPMLRASAAVHFREPRNGVSELRSIGGSVVARPNHLRLLDADTPAGDPTLVESYRRLADVFHEVLAEQSLDALLVRIADTVGDLIPHDTLTIYEADEAEQVLRPVLARDVYADEIMSTTISFSEGITGWAARQREPVLSNQAHLDPRVRTVPGTPTDPEALICIPLIARGRIKGALNVYREGADVAFSELEFEVAKRFGDVAALALDNAEIRERLERQARTDSLTGLFNHSVFYERLLEALQEASRNHVPIAVLMLDIDDFKHVNDVHGHAVGDELLGCLADALRGSVRPEDVVCRLGGEEFAVVMVGCSGDDAVRVAERIETRLAAVEFPGIGRMTVSVGVALGPEHAMNPRELAACAEAAMMTAKAQGKGRIVVYAEDATARPAAPGTARDLRIAHLKMLQSLSGKLNRLNDVREIGEAIAGELRSLIDYHNCRVFVSDGDELALVSFRGELSSSAPALPVDLLRMRVGEGITGRCAELGESIVVADAASCEYARQIEGTEAIEESLLAVPLRYGSRVVGVVVVSKLGLDQFG